jgi:hypothetical protein
MAAKTPQQDLVDQLGEVKDAIGEWHDWELLISVANDVFDRAPRCPLLGELKRISHEKYEHALRITENMRRKYFHPPKGGTKRNSSSRISGLAQPLLAATASLAA